MKRSILWPLGGGRGFPESKRETDALHSACSRERRGRPIQIRFAGTSRVGDTSRWYLPMNVATCCSEGDCLSALTGEAFGITAEVKTATIISACMVTRCGESAGTAAESSRRGPGSGCRWRCASADRCHGRRQFLTHRLIQAIGCPASGDREAADDAAMSRSSTWTVSAQRVSTLSTTGS